ncbi:BnaC06g00870D [Brassica napus]|uniref:BnaC06g00870D protein n=1 Tax=Brassica napus TaxID=3708 RepID=A0A078FHC6_BRANA|nr:BnaC06g00870D [Brassica napus]
MSDITIFPEYRLFLDNSCLASLLMELVLPKFLLVLRSSVAGSLVLKIRDTSIYVLIKGSANWSLDHSMCSIFHRDTSPFSAQLA